MAGYWLAFVSVPFFQFFLLRWYVQFLIYCWFLFRVSRLKLNLVALHPDRPAGLAFVAEYTVAFTPLLFAQSAVFASQIADRILYNGESLLTSELTIVGLVIFPVAAVVAPLLSFTLPLIRTKRKGLEKYGAFASRMSWILVKNGWKAEPTTRRPWGAETYSPWLIWATASKLLARCGQCPSGPMI